MWVPVLMHHSARVSTSVLSLVDFGMVDFEAFIADSVTRSIYNPFVLGVYDMIRAVFTHAIHTLMTHF